MESLVEVTLDKVHILAILDCYYRLFSLIYISYDSEGITNKDPVRIERFWQPPSSPENLLNGMNGMNASNFKICSWRAWRTILQDPNQTFEVIKQVSGGDY